MNKIAVLRFTVACIGGWAFGYALSGTIHNGLGEDCCCVVLRKRAYAERISAHCVHDGNSISGLGHDRCRINM